MTRIGLNGSLRINSGLSQLRTSSNQSFQEQFRSGIKSGVELTSSALGHVAKPIPGMAALSASLSDAARSLSTNNKLDSGISSSNPSTMNGETNLLEDEMVKNGQDLLREQMRVAQITTELQVKSNLVKSWTDTSKRIGENMR